MAESEETPETNVEEVEAQAAPEEGATEAPAAEPTTETRKERNAAKRAAKAKPAAGPRTLEERLAERAAHRERNASQRRAYRAKQKVKRAEARKSQPAPEEQHAPEHGPGKPKVRQGVVVSDKAEKTIVVRVDIARRHKRYHKILRSSIDAARPRRDATTPTRATRCASRSAGRCRAPSAGGCSRSWSVLDDPERDPAARGRQHRRAGDPHDSRHGRLAPPLRGRGRHHRGHGQAGQPERDGQEGRRRQGGRRAHEEGVRARRRHLHRLRRERGRDHRRPEQPARHAHLRPGGARTARRRVHEDRLARPGGALAWPPRSATTTT